MLVNIIKLILDNSVDIQIEIYYKNNKIVYLNNVKLFN